ncbi:MAG: helix-turn-helix domain-containing protein [Candidatus Parcubacteria bacterium]|nr:helix-turn-helix domain-containing protein [Candidatus Parcubacteria bacterium]
MSNEKFLTIKEVADILRVSERSIMRYIDSGRLIASKIGQWRINQTDLDNFIKKSQNF